MGERSRRAWIVLLLVLVAGVLVAAWALGVAVALLV